MLQNRVRIISGLWRGRKISFPDLPGLRPSPDRVRETLFNWLAPVIGDSFCLDLFAGSGALGFEALSRGANEVIFVDESEEVFQALSQTQQQLKTEKGQIYRDKAEHFLQLTKEPFDIIFLDPPFHQNKLLPTLNVIQARSLLKPKGFVYIEQARKNPEFLTHPDWRMVKEKMAGQVLFQLIQYI